MQCLSPPHLPIPLLLAALFLGCSDGQLHGGPDGFAPQDQARDMGAASDTRSDGRADTQPEGDAPISSEAGREQGVEPPDGGPLHDVTRDSGSSVDSTRDATVDRIVLPAPDTRVDQRPAADSTVDSGALYSGTFPAATMGFKTATLRVAGVDRSLSLYLPANLPADAPVMILYHGTDGAADDALWGADATTLADSAKVIMVAPQARRMSVGDWDNHVAGQRYFETYPNVDPGSNADLLLVRAIIAEAARAYGADTRRVYALGFSNGAFFAQFAAMMMPDRLAAFAENSGGLVRCATTGSCSFRGSGTSCADLASQAGYCSCTGIEKPGPTPTNGRKPPGYIVHSSNDSTVSVYYSCALAARMQALGYPISVTIRASGGHAWQPNFATEAWAFLSQHRLP